MVWVAALTGLYKVSLFFAALAGLLFSTHTYCSSLPIPHQFTTLLLIDRGAAVAISLVTMMGPLLRSLCSSTRRSLSSSSSSYRSTSPFKSSPLQRIPGLNRNFSAAAAPASAAVPGRSFDPTRLRNVAVIAHVDHEKTTLMDSLLSQCGADIPHERARERGIAISSKVTSIRWGEHALNMVDTPWHPDSGGEVDRLVGMAQGALLVIDAGEGPLAQTHYILAKALKYGLRPLLLLNKADRPSVSEERCDEVKSLVFDLFKKLGATAEQLDFPVLYASAKEGWASSTFTKSPHENSKNMAELLDAIVKHVPSPTANLEAPFQMLATSIPCGEHESPSDSGDEVERAGFERWMSKHGRRYKDTDEWNLRFRAYKSNLRYIDSVNSENLSYKLGANLFADLTAEEFKSNIYRT